MVDSPSDSSRRRGDARGRWIRARWTQAPSSLVRLSRIGRLKGSASSAAEVADPGLDTARLRVWSPVLGLHLRWRGWRRRLAARAGQRRSSADRGGPPSRVATGEPRVGSSLVGVTPVRISLVAAPRSVLRRLPASRVAGASFGVKLASSSRLPARAYSLTVDPPASVTTASPLVRPGQSLIKASTSIQPRDPTDLVAARYRAPGPVADLGVASTRRATVMRTPVLGATVGAERTAARSRATSLSSALPSRGAAAPRSAPRGGAVVRRDDPSAAEIASRSQLATDPRLAAGRGLLARIRWSVPARTLVDRRATWTRVGSVTPVDTASADDDRTARRLRTASPESRWRAAVRATPLESPTSLPAAWSGVVRRLTGRGSARYTSGPATRNALTAAGALGATTGSVIHLSRPPGLGEDDRVVTHELAHSRTPLTRPRFLLRGHGGGADEEERRATAAERLFSGATAAGDEHSAGLVGGLPVAGLPGPGSISQRTAVPAAPPPARAGAAAGSDSTDGEQAITGSRPDPVGPTGAWARDGDQVAPETRGRRLPNTAPVGGASTGAEAGGGNGPGHPAPVDVERLMESLEDRLLHEIERRGGRYEGVF